MPELTLILKEGEHRMPFVPGKSLRDILDTTDFRVRSGCRGMGACGLCRVRILAGKVSGPTPNEQMHLGSTQLAQGVRLACQVMAEQDLQIVVLAPAPESDWRSLPDGEGRRIKRFSSFSLKDLPQQVESPYGVAVELG
ncbi:MAG: 2Fe-2S iron-sulfur cluster binding domain-containing protein, partial [Deltaproteobacteria bacterium]|nr:2Fe-2S iron-sulfur cluster binding domain-containing protein [Deltaproteobacteria bacterium]